MKDPIHPQPDGVRPERKYGSAQEFVETRILGGFLKNDEFGLGNRHVLSLEQQIAEILVATPPSKKGFDVAVDRLPPQLINPVLQLVQHGSFIAVGPQPFQTFL
jgi:hypothetical protein